MALPRPTSGDSWFSGFDLPNDMFQRGDRDYELYEEEDEFVLSVALPGYDPADVNVSWDDGILNISAEHDDERWRRQRTYHRRFRFPKMIDDDEIEAHYRNGILEVRLPVETNAVLSGREIEVQT